MLEFAEFLKFEHFVCLFPISKPGLVVVVESGKDVVGFSAVTFGNGFFDPRKTWLQKNKTLNCFRLWIYRLFAISGAKNV